VWPETEGAPKGSPGAVELDSARAHMGWHGADPGKGFESAYTGTSTGGRPPALRLPVLARARPLPVPLAQLKIG
jgi:hypothetical protein